MRKGMSDAEPLTLLRGRRGSDHYPETDRAINRLLKRVRGRCRLPVALRAQLSARRQNVASARTANRRRKPRVHHDLREPVDRRTTAGLERTAGPGVERDQVHLDGDAGRTGGIGGALPPAPGQAGRRRRRRAVRPSSPIASSAAEPGSGADCGSNCEPPRSASVKPNT